MSVLPVGFGSAVAGGYQIQRSLRFNSADTAYLSRTPASASNRQTWTWSGWIKRSNLGFGNFFAASNGSNIQFYAAFNSNDTIGLVDYTGTININLNTTQVFRDVGAWAHFVISMDTTQATASNRLKFYVNGSQVTVFSTAIYPTQNYNTAVNSTVIHAIGREEFADLYYLNGYLTEINFIDSPSLVGSTTNASTTITLSSGSTTNIQVGWNIGGTNIPSGATVSSITNSTTFVISAAATGTGSSITFGATPPISSFGETDSATGVWKPKAYTGTYGTNGFYVNFSDNSNNTAATLGKDYSGNGNNWTPNNFVVSPTTSVNNDSMVDSPTLYGTDTGAGGEVRGNYCTMNPLTTATLPTLANGNLDVSVSATGVKIAQGTWWFPSSGKWYYECTFNNASSGANGMFIGITSPTRGPNVTRSTAGAYFFYASSSGLLNSNGTDIVTGLSTISANEVFKLAVDIDNSKVWIGRGSNWYNSSGGFTGDPAAGTNPTFSISAIGLTPMAGFDASSVSLSMNFGQRAFSYTAPSGFKALCTQNLPPVTIGATSTTQANDYFDVTLYTGNNTAGRNITNSGSFQPDFVWIKNRSGTNNHILTDAVRGATKTLFSDSTSAELTVAGALTAFNSNGFQVGYDGTAIVNASANNYVGWQWNAGGSNATNTSGSVTSTVRSNTISGFSIVTFTDPNNSSNYTVGHGCQVNNVATIPSMIIVKERGTSGNWIVWHSSATTTVNQYLFLNDTAGTGTLTNVWGAAVPTSTVFGLRSGTSVSLGDTVVAYCFAPVPGYSAFGSYTGNGAADGPFVYTGFRPAFVMVKNTVSAATSNWIMKDDLRASPFNPTTGNLYANLNFAEDVTATVEIDLLSNGFKARGTYGGINGSTNSIIYMAFAESPFKYSLAR